MSLKDTISDLFLKYLAVPPAPRVLPDKIHIACIGDSITFGAGVQGRKKMTWEYCLNEILGEEYQVLNYGISGRTLQKDGDRPYTIEKFYKISHQCRAENYLIMLGTNDAKPYNWNKERYERELDLFVRSYAGLPNGPKVILMTPPQCFPEEKTGIVAFDINADTIDNDITEIIKKKGNDMNLQVIDLHKFTQGHPEWFTDGVHPNYEGNKKIAAYIAGQAQFRK